MDFIQDLPRLVRQAEPWRHAHVPRLVQKLDFFPGSRPRVGAFDDDFRTPADASHAPEQSVGADKAELVHFVLQEGCSRCEETSKLFLINWG